MLRDSYDVHLEATPIRSNNSVLLRGKTVQKDQGWSWVVLLAAFLTLFVTNGVHTSFGILYAALISHFNSGREETGVKLGAFGGRISREEDFRYFIQVAYLWGVGEFKLHHRMCSEIRVTTRVGFIRKGVM